MKYFLPLFVLSLTACQPADSGSKAPSDAVSAPVIVEDNSVDMTDIITLVAGQPVSEPRACIVPIRVENGTDSEVSVTMIGFTITGPGDDSQGNMFAPVAASGTTSEARVILEGQSCDAYDMIRVPEVLCKADGQDCAGKIEFKNGDQIAFSQAG